MSRLQASSEGAGLSFLPYVIFIVLLLLNNVPGNVNGMESIDVGLYLAPLFFIGLTAESDFTPVFLVLIGIFQDVLSETPLGYWSVLFVLFYVLCVSQRPLLQNASFGSYWVTFSVLLSIIYLLGYLMALLRDDMVVASLAMLLSLIASCLVFPLVYGPLYMFREHLVSGERG